MSKKKKSKKQLPDAIKKCTYYIDGMHCASCEILIEKKFLKKDGVQYADASMGSKKVEIRYKGTDKPTLDTLNKEFKEHGYQFSNRKWIHEKDTPMMQMVEGELRINRTKIKKFFSTLIIVAIMIFGFKLFEKIPYNKPNIDSSPYAFTILGIIAGVSSCAALIGGIILSMTKQWNELYIDEKTTIQKAKPHIMFHLGRLFSFTILGGILGIIGKVLGDSFVLGENQIGNSILVILVAVMMLILALQMLEVPWAQKLRLSAPKSLTKYTANEKNFMGKYMPLLTGFLTAFLPCGITLIAQGAALASANIFSGALIMFLFSLGTLIPLSVISFSGVKLNSKPHLTATFNRIAGILIIFFVISTFNSQLNLFGLPSLSDIDFSKKENIEEVLIVDNTGIQKLTFIARDFEYVPTSSTTLRAGVPTVLEVDNQGVQGCGVYMASRGLFDGYISLQAGMNSIEFTPQVGTYKLTCTMGMVPPVTIKVI